MPAPVPDVIPPTSEKIDLAKLTADIPKFFNSRTFNEEHKKWWSDFLGDKNSLFAPKEEPLVWLLDDVVSIKQREIAGPISQREPSGTDDGLVQQLGLPERPLEAPKDVEDMVVEQLCEIPQVNRWPLLAE